MKQIKIFMLPLFIIAVAFAVSCKKNNDDLNQTSNNGGVEDYGPQEVTAPNEQYIEKQLRWVARGIPKLAKNNNPFRNEVENRLLNYTDDYFSESHSYFQGWFTTNLSLDYEQEVYDNVNLHFSGANDYNRDYFESFDFGDFTWSVGLYAPDLDVVNKSLQHVVTVEPLDESVYESWAYFIDSTTLGLDSVLLTENNEDDYYVWVVYAHHPYEKRLKQSTETCACGDGSCEEARCGEGWPDCSADCDDPTGNGKKTLMLIEYSLETDNKPYQEGWLNGSYEIYFAYLIEEASSPYDNLISTTDQVNVANPVPRDDDERIGILLDKIKRREVRRCNGSKCRGDNPPRVSPQDYTLYSKYDPANNNVVIAFYEYDAFNQPTNYNSFTNGPNDLLVMSRSGIYNNNAPFIIPSTTGWTSHTHNGISGEILEVVSSDGELKFKLFRYDN